MGFDSIESAPIPTPATTQAAAPVASVAQNSAQEKTQASVAAQTPAQPTAFSLGDAVSFIAAEPDLSNMAAADAAASGFAETTTDAEAGAGGTKTATGGAWYKNIFSNSPHSPEDVETKIGADMDGLAPKMGVMLSDALFPAFIATLKDEESAGKYKADDAQKLDLEAAWKYWLMTMGIRVTPGFYLIYIHGIIYGIPFMGGVAAYIQRVQLYGWHWPWSKSWKKKAAKMQSEIPGTRGPINQPPPAPMKVVHNEQASAPAPVQQSPPQQTAPPPPPPAPPKQMKKCLYTGQEFEVGKGHPKKSKNPDLVDGFIDAAAYYGYRNANGNLGNSSNKK